MQGIPRVRASEGEAAGLNPPGAKLWRSTTALPGSRTASRIDSVASAAETAHVHRIAAQMSDDLIKTWLSPPHDDYLVTRACPQRAPGHRAQRDRPNEDESEQADRQRGLGPTISQR